MIHQYQLNGYNIVLDTCSGAIHVVDEVAYDLIAGYKNEPEEELIRRVCEKYKDREGVTEAEVRACLDDVKGLEAAGKLYSPDTFADLAGQFKGKRENVIKAMCLHVAHTCNLNCSYCFASQGKYHGERALMSLEVGKRALDFLIENSGSRHNLEVDFFGGEPLMNFPVIKEVVAYGRELEKRHGKVFKFTTTTNAVLMNDEIMDFLNREMDNVVISIDGRPEVHDRMRPTPNGKGSYDLIIEKAKEFARRRGQQRYYLRGTFTRYNLDFANDVLHLADQGFEQLSIEPVVTDESHDYAIRESDLPRVFEEYERLGREYVIRRRNPDKWFSFFHFMVDLTGGPCLRKRLTGCGAGNEYVAVTADGDIYPCHQFVGREGMRMGSVLDGTFDTAMQRRFQQNTVLTKEKCSQCWARFYCSGGCQANAHTFNGDISKPYEMECKLEQKRLECAMAIQAIERENA